MFLHGVYPRGQPHFSLNRQKNLHLARYVYKKTVQSSVNSLDKISDTVIKWRVIYGGKNEESHFRI